MLRRQRLHVLITQFSRPVSVTTGTHLPIAPFFFRLLEKYKPMLPPKMSPHIKVRPAGPISCRNWTRTNIPTKHASSATGAIHGRGGPTYHIQNANTPVPRNEAIEAQGDVFALQTKAAAQPSPNIATTNVATVFILLHLQPRTALPATNRMHLLMRLRRNQRLHHRTLRPIARRYLVA